VLRISWLHSLLVLGLAACSIDGRTPSVSTLGQRPTTDASPNPPIGSSENPPLGAPDMGALGAPQLSVEPTTLDFGLAVVGLPARTRLAVGNMGDAALPEPAVALQSEGDPAFIVLHNLCESDIAPAEHCDVRLQVLASRAGLLGSILDVSSGGQSLTVPLSATGVERGPLIVAPAPGNSGDFGAVVLGAQREAVFNVSNPGKLATGPLGVAVVEAQFQRLPAADGECDPDVTSLDPGQSCRVRVAFSPARRGPIDASLIVTSSLGASALRLAGNGQLPATLVAPEAVEFGGVAVSGTGKRSLSIENRGDEPVELSGIALAATSSASEPFLVESGDCGVGQILAGGSACSVTVAFRPLVASLDHQGQLVVSAAGGIERTVTLRGSGLTPGSLSVAAQAGSSGDFGEVLVGQSSTQRFVVANSSAQPSGPLELHSYGDFALLPPAAADDCESGVSSLVDGQSCNITVTLTPRKRGQYDGTLTVSSALAGAAHLSLTGLASIPARLELRQTEFDFGRVPTETLTQQSVTVRNVGDRLLSPVDASVEASSGDASAFVLDNGCSEAISAGSSCAIGVSFAPTLAGDYAAVLHLSGAAGGAVSALLIGTSFPRGRLVLEALGGVSDFGDVALGSTDTIEFTLTNPTNAPSGRLIITSSNNLFALNEGDCDLDSDSGLASGASCTFSVSFDPTTSDAVTATLSVQSSEAGETALSLNGRGRAPAKLSAVSNRDFGLATVGQEVLSELANTFTWPVFNEGDSETGTLQIANSNPEEFVVESDTCSDAVLAGHASCALTIRFRPTSGGQRSANLAILDSASGQELTLAMTGTGRLIAGPGESCANGASCASGVCTAGVCCDRPCASSCQACSAGGVCQDQDQRQECGNGTGQCFGVNRCLLPELRACSGDEQCGAGNCERRLGSQNPNDRICCLENCANGTQCDPQSGRCQQPTLAEGASCGAAGQPACGSGLECKSCRGGGRRCTPASDCCGGCDAGYACIGGQRCGCPNGSNGRPQIDCGNGLCILDRQNACCPIAPQCPGNLPVCDGSVGLCRQCLTAGDCPGRGSGTSVSCNNFTCNYACSFGNRDCGGLNCVGPGQCCADSECGACGVCSNGFCSSRCTNGSVCDAPTNSCVFPSADPLVSCDPQNSGVGRDCGWSFAPGGVGLSCVPGTSISFLCDCADCTGDPMMRVCEGFGSCFSATALGQNDDSCDRCPEVITTCPSSGVVSVMVAPFTSGNPFTCIF
jgi:hypothetical protein